MRAVEKGVRRERRRNKTPPKTPPAPSERGILEVVEVVVWVVF